jgi:cyclin-C
VRLDTYTNFLAASNVNLAEVMESVRELLGLYDSWQQYDEGSVRQGMKMLLMALHNSQSKQG